MGGAGGGGGATSGAASDVGGAPGDVPSVEYPVLYALSGDDKRGGGKVPAVAVVAICLTCFCFRFLALPSCASIHDLSRAPSMPSTAPVLHRKLIPFLYDHSKFALPTVFYILSY